MTIMYKNVLTDHAYMGQRVYEHWLQEGELVKNLEIFLNEWKIIIEFHFHMMWKIMQITEDRIIQAEIHLASAFTALVDSIFHDLHSFWHPTQPHSVINCSYFFSGSWQPKFQRFCRWPPSSWSRRDGGE